MISEPTLSAMKILLVDDEPANLALLQYALKGAGFAQLRSTTNPREVMAIYDEFEPDLILLDLMMPCVDGFEVMQQIGPARAAGRLPAHPGVDRRRDHRDQASRPGSRRVGFSHQAV